MSFIRSLPDSEAEGRAAEFFAEDRAKDGFVWNLTRVFAQRPAVLDGWRALAGAVRGGMDLRRYELVTLASARALRGSYCMLAHGKILREKFCTAEQVVALAHDPATSDLPAADIAIMTFAAKVARSADQVTAADVEALRAHGLADGEILDVVLAAAARAFFCKVLDGLGVQPDAAYGALEPAPRDALAIGRPIATG